MKNVDYVFCTDSFLLEMNRQYLNHDTYTDIITFPLSKPGEPIESEIYISVDRIRENAGSFGTGFQSELLRVIFHGALHLCGYKDKTREQSFEMRSKEEQYLKAYLG